MPSNTEKIPATDVVVARIRKAIERGELKSGDRLPPERELAVSLGVSRPSIRSGLKTLEGMGVLQIRQGAGTFITGGPPALDAEPLTFLAALHGFSREQMFEARIALEVSVVAFAAERATPDQVIAISDETTAMYASLDQPDTFLVHDIKFHRAIAAAANNPVLASLVEMVSSIFYKARQQTIRFATDLRVAADEHRGIYQAIRGHDVERARKAMTDHLRRAELTQTTEGVPAAQ
ncbi:MAG: FadR family transcriptional regulator [Acidobacteria bacterium]|nr:MAG: FadR family transcriptional regulator [Acidobacteriota bacterium]